VTKTAAGLAALHTSGVKSRRSMTLADELAECERVVARLARFEPEVRDAAAPLLARVAHLAGEGHADPSVAAHGTFRPAQVLVSGGDIAFIDFDSFAIAEPALDVSLFCASLKDVGLRAAREGGERDAAALARHVAALRELCELFVSSYESAAPVSRPRIELWQTLHLLTIVLHCWTKVKASSLAHRLPLLEDHLRTSALLAPAQ
jgi:aminoglycoside phosphotransferase (APT) family kinase protein